MQCLRLDAEIPEDSCSKDISHQASHQRLQRRRGDGRHWRTRGATRRRQRSIGEENPSYQQHHIPLSLSGRGPKQIIRHHFPCWARSLCLNQRWIRQPFAANNYKRTDHWSHLWEVWGKSSEEVLRRSMQNCTIFWKQALRKLKPHLAPLLCRFP